MSGSTSPITARFAQIQSTREAASAAVTASNEENRRATDAAGAAVHAKARNRLGALRRRSSERRDLLAMDRASVIGDTEAETPEEGSPRLRAVGPADDELEGRDWLR